jgi:hypothetical protein
LSQYARRNIDCGITPERLFMLMSQKLKSYMLAIITSTAYFLKIHVRLGAYLLAVELTLVLLLERLFMMLSPQLTTPPLLVMLNVRNLYRSSPHRGLYGFSGRLQTLGLTWSGTACNRRGTWSCEYGIENKTGNISSVMFKLLFLFQQ